MNKKQLTYLVIGLAVGYMVKKNSTALGFDNPAVDNNNHIRPETVTGNEEMPWWNPMGWFG